VETVTKSGDSDEKFQTEKNVQTLNACLLWAVGVLEVVVGMEGQCGSKRDTKWQGGEVKHVLVLSWL
jgi:hypothetical protein